MRELNQMPEIERQKSKRVKSSFGFTLIEVIVSITILSISFVLIMQLFADGLKSARLSRDYTRAVVLAKDKMEELSETPVNGSGDFEDGFRWETEVGPYGELEETEFNMLKLKVNIYWDIMLKKPRSLELVSLKAVSNEDEI